MRGEPHTSLGDVGSRQVVWNAQEVEEKRNDEEAAHTTNVT